MRLTNTSALRALLLVGSIAALPAASSCGGSSSTENVARSGQELYGQYCALCHGDRGEGYKADNAPQLANAEYLAVASDPFLARAIARGRPSTTMSAWSKSRGGPLVDRDIDAIVSLVRSWQARPFVSVDADRVDGDPARGEPIYARECAGCHGGQGAGGLHPQLSNPEFLAAASDGFLRASIARGRPGTPMPAYESRLTPTELGDVVRLIRSWQKPVDEAGGTPAKPGELVNIVINPSGPDATLPAPTDFVPVDDVKREIDRGAAIILADARAPSDYVKEHIVGAISVPFYDVGAYAAQIPKDKYIVTYCGCPHAVSGQSRDAFRALGYPRVAVLDEGVYVWKERGYPVKSGPLP
jgi:cytochrome c oxidase cbb3-type subunit 3